MLRPMHALTRRGRLLVAPFAALAADAAVTLLVSAALIVYSLETDRLREMSLVSRNLR
jgi:hypothetical protein